MFPHALSNKLFSSFTSHFLFPSVGLRARLAHRAPPGRGRGRQERRFCWNWSLPLIDLSTQTGRDLFFLETQLQRDTGRLVRPEAECRTKEVVVACGIVVKLILICALMLTQWLTVAQCWPLTKNIFLARSPTARVCFRVCFAYPFFKNRWDACPQMSKSK